MACHYEGELNAKGCTTVPVFFDLNKISCKKVEDDIEQRKKLDRLYFFHIEENGKRRKINFLNFSNEFDESGTHSRNCVTPSSDDASCPTPSINDSRDDVGTIKMSRHTHLDHNSIPTKQESILLKGEPLHLHSVEDGENYCANKKYNHIKNKYYEKINSLLKQVHMSQISRRNNSSRKGMHVCEDVHAKHYI